MARNGFSTSNVLRCSSAVLAAPPLTMAIWVKSSLGASARLFQIANSVGISFFGLNITSTGGCTAQTGDESAASTAFSANSVAAGAWGHFAGIFASSIDRRAYVNGGVGTASTTSRVPVSLDRTSIGGSDRATITSPFATGDLAEASIWNIALTEADLAVLAGGLSPLLMHPEALVGYWPLIGQNSPENNLLSNAATMSIIGTLAAAAQPPIIRPSSGIR